MEALVKMMATVVDSVQPAEEETEEFKENKRNLQQDSQLDIKYFACSPGPADLLPNDC